MASPPVGACDRREARLCAVTGGRGFMARQLVAALLRSGEWRVRITDLAPVAVLEPAEEEGILGAALRNGLAVYTSADVCDLAQLTQAFEGVETVFHTAAPDPRKNDFQLHYKVSVEGTKNVIDACTTCKVKRLIYTSSSCVVFDGVHGLFNVDESTPYPDKFPNAYLHTKAKAEKLVMRANTNGGLLTCCIRPSSIFGPGGIIVPNLVRYAATMFIIGDGKNDDDFVYVDNVAHGHVCAERTLSTKEGAMTIGGKAYFITNTEPMNLWDFYFMVLEELGYKRTKIRISSHLLVPIAYVLDWSYNKILSHYGMSEPPMLTPTNIKYLTLNRTFNCNKATQELGYKPIISLQEGVKKTIEHYHDLRA
ncbi:3beta-hydroxysteroid-dehydrogenase/decarboxylase-like [Hordeum vulgare subsp. vulgare]|uniref:3-beta hydroxysteroid dehydrogenase/isomerase domain-containing protein n=1 Tax=Hordeum vulgare subsp. vulgare TaxID=112509 RepID=A0A8I6Y3G6_HORVV|nr:3beta-hydroxysteroid-dehydrogenase/decarboxylase-like [Hordeum vulgare subsp. vulgare]